MAAKRKGFRRRIYKRDRIGRFARVGGNVARKRARTNVARRKITRSVNRSAVGRSARRAHRWSYGHGERSPMIKGLSVDRPGVTRATIARHAFKVTKDRSRTRKNALGAVLQDSNIRREQVYAKRYNEFQRRGGNTRGMRRPNLFMDMDVFQARIDGRKYRPISRRTIVSNATKVHRNMKADRARNRHGRRVATRAANASGRYATGLTVFTPLGREGQRLYGRKRQRRKAQIASFNAYASGETVTNALRGRKRNRRTRWLSRYL